METQIKKIYIGFDFSMNKPAATFMVDNRLYFYFWPLDITQTGIEKYRAANVRVVSRGLDSIDKKDKKNSQLVLIHTIRSTELANLIVRDIDDFINAHTDSNEKCELYVASEGLSYASKGDATLNLATYKGVLLSKLYEHYGNVLKRMFTYSPMTMKSVAGCAGKNVSKQINGKQQKQPMISAFCREPLNSPFKTAIEDGTLIAKTNFIEGVDDLVDSYWALKTMLIKDKASIS